MMPRPPKLPELQPRERLLAAGGMALLLIVALDRLVLSPWMRHTRTMREEIHRMDATLQGDRRLLARQPAVLAQLARYQRYLRPAIADELQMGALLQEVEELAGADGVHVVEIKPLGVEVDGQVKRYSLELQSRSTLADWTAFLYHLETSPALYDVVRAKLSTIEETPDQLQGYLRLASVVLQPSPASDSTTSGGGP